MCNEDLDLDDQVTVELARALLPPSLQSHLETEDEQRNLMISRAFLNLEQQEQEKVMNLLERNSEYSLMEVINAVTARTRGDFDGWY